MIYILLALVIVLPFVGVFLKRRARAAGAQRWEQKKDRNAADDGLGATLVLSTERATAEALIAPILESRKRVRRQEDGSWAHTHYNTDDVVYTLSSTPTESTLAVSRAIEFAGTLNGMKAWRKLRQAIAIAAEEQGIPVAESSQPLVRAAGVEIGGAQVWLPAS